MSSLGGSTAAAGTARAARRRSPCVSSTDSVVWESQTTLSGSRTVDRVDVRPGRRRAGVVGRLAGGADRPPRGPRGRSAGCRSPRAANRLASWCTLVTSGQVASIVLQLRAAAACSWTAGATPCAEKTTIGALGHLVGLLDEDRAPRLQGLDHVLVVHDLLAHVDRRAVAAPAPSRRSARPGPRRRSSRGGLARSTRLPVRGVGLQASATHRTAHRSGAARPVSRSRAGRRCRRGLPGAP